MSFKFDERVEKDIRGDNNCWEDDNDAMILMVKTDNRPRFNKLLTS